MVNLSFYFLFATPLKILWKSVTSFSFPDFSFSNCFYSTWQWKEAGHIFSFASLSWPVSFLSYLSTAYFFTRYQYYIFVSIITSAVPVALKILSARLSFQYFLPKDHPTYSFKFISSISPSYIQIYLLIVL